MDPERNQHCNMHATDRKDPGSFVSIVVIAFARIAIAPSWFMALYIPFINTHLLTQAPPQHSFFRLLHLTITKYVIGILTSMASRRPPRPQCQ